MRKIIQEVAAVYGIGIEVLEGGNFTIPQWQILYPLVEQFEKSGSEEDARHYIEQKAKFLTVKK